MSENEKKEEEEIKYEILSEDVTEVDYSFKIIVIGDSAVGKSSLTLKGTKDHFKDFYTPTIGFEFLSFNIRIKDKIVKLQIWDTCGQEVYRSLISSFYRNSSLAIIVYAIDNQESFDNLESWLDEIKSQTHPYLKIFLIGNKVDLENERVLEAVLNKKPYEKEKEYEYEEQIVATKTERKRITFKELAVLLISGFFTFEGVMNMVSYILTLIEISSFEYATGLLMNIAIQLVFLGIFGVAFAFTINAIFRNKSLKVPLILLMIGTGLNFALNTYAGISSLIAHLDGHMKGASSYSVNGYPTTYEKMVAGTIVRVTYSEIVSAAFLAASILLFISNRKQQKIEVMKTTAAEVY